MSTMSICLLMRMLGIFLSFVLFVAGLNTVELPKDEPYRTLSNLAIVLAFVILVSSFIR